MCEEVLSGLSGRLYFATLRCKQQKNNASHHYFRVDHDWTQESSKFKDSPYHGPSNLAEIYHMCFGLNTALYTVLASKKIVLYTSADEGPAEDKKRAKFVFLCGAFAICQLRMTAKEVYDVIMKHFLSSTLAPYCDFKGNLSHYLSILDCIKGFEKAVTLGFFEYGEFDLTRYEREERCFDVNWIIPGKLLALSDPQRRPESFSRLKEYLRKSGVKGVVRLNRISYDACCFTTDGFSHNDLYFKDGGIPSEEIVEKFMMVVDNCDGAVAVHCYAGLGRTGTLIACYLIRHYQFSAAEAVGWLRICRPGSVTTRQHEFLVQEQKRTMRGYAA